jgi:hypothetical protein
VRKFAILAVVFLLIACNASRDEHVSYVVRKIKLDERDIKISTKELTSVDRDIASSEAASYRFALDYRQNFECPNSFKKWEDLSGKVYKCEFSEVTNEDLRTISISIDHSKILIDYEYTSL